MKFDFTKNKTVDDIAKVPEDFRSLYVADGDGGKYKLDTSDAKVKSAVSALVGMNTALNASRQEAENAKKKAVDLSGLVDYGTTPAEIAEAFETKLAEAGKVVKGKGAEDTAAAVKSAQDAMQTKHLKDLEARDTRNGLLKNQLHNVLVTGEAKAALANAKAVDVDIVLPHVLANVKVVEEDGKFGVTVVNPDGTPRYSGTEAGPLSIGEFVTEMRGSEKYKMLFRSEDTGGGGAPPTNRGGGVPPTGDKRTSVQKISDGLKAGQASK